MAITQAKSRHRIWMTAWSMSGEGGIRTLGTLTGTLVFETSTIGRSVTSPSGFIRFLAGESTSTSRWLLTNGAA